MITINELCNQIDELNKKIEEEEKNSLKRKVIRKQKIKELKEEKTRAGFHNDPLWVQQCNSQIKQLEHDLKRDYIYEFKSQIEMCKRKISDLIIEYYQNGLIIEDIFKKEDIPQNIQKKWLELSDFGKGTGYLFIDEIDDDEYNWRYYNPFKNIELHSERLDGLISKIRNEGEELVEFNKELVTTSLNKELKFYQNTIDNYIEKFNEDSSDAFEYLIKYSNKFSQNQLSQLSNLFIQDINNYVFFNKFNQILTSNKERFDKEFFDKIYSGIIDFGINNLYDLNYWNSKDVFFCLMDCADEFNENQIISFYEFIITKTENYRYVGKLDYILNENLEDFEDSFIDSIYSGLIDNGINKLSDMDNPNINYVFSCFERYNEKFNETQILQLYDVLIEDVNKHQYFADFFNILKVNEEINGSLSDNIYKNIIDNAIDNLENSKLNPVDVFAYLKVYSDKFNLTQLNKMVDFVLSEYSTCGFAEDFKNILEVVGDNMDDSFENVHINFIDGKINELSKVKSFNDLSKDLINDLRYFADDFNVGQLKNLCNIVVNNSNICNFADDFNYILEKNDDSDLKNEVYNDIINSRLQKLKESDTNSISECLFFDLEVYSKVFSQNQINNFCEIVFNKKYSNYYPNPIFKIISVNEFKIDQQFNEIITGMKIDSKLKELKDLRFGYSTARQILDSLAEYAHQFSESQINKLCNISISNSQVYNCFYCMSSLRQILTVNRDKIDDELYEDTVSKNGL